MMLPATSQNWALNTQRNNNMEKTFDDYLKASPSERRKMNMSEILGEERLAKTKEQMSLEEAAKEYAEGPECTWVGTTALEEAFIAGAKWKYQKDRAEFAKLKAKEWSDGYNEGIVRGKEQMLEDAEPAEIGYFNQRGLSILTEKAIERMPVSEGDKVLIIIVKAEEE